MHRKQRGVATSLIIYGVGAIVIAALTTAVVSSYNRALREAETAKAAEQKLRAEYDTLTQAHTDQLNENLMLRLRSAQTDALLAKRAAEKRTDEEIKRKTDELINEISRAFPEVRTWMDTPVPPALVDRLRRTGDKDSPSGKDNPGKTSPKPDSAGIRGGVAGKHDERRAP